MKAGFAIAVIPAALMAWQGAARPASFEVADIRPSDPSVIKAGKGRVLPGGRIEVPRYTLKELIMFAWGAQEDTISGGPKWMSEDRFDIVAKAPGDAGQQELRGMLQSLLKERFGLVTHDENKPMPVYTLTVVKTPQESSGGQSQCHWDTLEGGLRRRICTNMPMGEFARQLPMTGGIGIDLPVVDKTGLAGKYDVQFDVGDSKLDDGPTIFAALIKAGLRLDKAKEPMPVMVVDEARKPAAN